MRRVIMLLAGALLGLGQFALVGVGFSGTALADGSCSPAGSSGLTAEVIAVSGQTITSVIDASGCDVGIYIGPGVHNVVVNNTTVQNATYHAILAQDTNNVVVQNSTVTNNAAGGESTDFPETKAIQFSGVSNGTIRNNIVKNNGGGGIAVLDDGPIPTGTPNEGALSAGNNNKVIANDVEDNTNGCGIVVAAYNPGAGVLGNMVMNNTVINNSAGIVIAADSAFTLVQNDTVMLNTAWGNGLADVVVHSNLKGDLVNATRIMFNQLGSNDSGRQGIGVIVGAESPGAVILNTSIVGNHFTNELIAVATRGTTRLFPIGNFYDDVYIPVGPEPSSPV